MHFEPRFESEYSPRQVEAARRVLVDIGQVLGSFRDCMVVVGGWVPDLLVPEGDPQHVGSIDVDVALDAKRLNDGRYAELLKLLLDTNRYRLGEKQFQFVTDIDLDDGDPAIQVELEFLAPAEVKMKRNRPKLVAGFRVLQFPACAAAFQKPVEREIVGRMANGAENRVRLRVASLSDFVIMKAHAINGRDKPKDVYDLCYCLDTYPGGIPALGQEWRSRSDESLIVEAVHILREKFATVNHYGPRQLANFHNSQDPDQDAQYARRAYELVKALLGSVTD